jgi:hypothetical protein
LPVILAHPAEAAEDSICEKVTVFAPDAINRLRQHPFRWGTTRWDAYYRLGRAAIEAKHGEARQEDVGFLHTHITSTSFMPVVGTAAALGFAVQNLHKLRDWGAWQAPNLANMSEEQQLLFAEVNVLRDWLAQHTTDAAHRAPGGDGDADPR